MKNQKAYVVIITETAEEREEINRRIPHREHWGEVKVEAFSMCSQMCGIRFEEIRPTIIIENYTSWNEQIEFWRNEVVLPMAARNGIII